MMRINVEPKRMKKFSKILNVLNADERKKNRNIAWLMIMEDDVPQPHNIIVTTIVTTITSVVTMHAEQALEPMKIQVCGLDHLNRSYYC